MLRRRPIARRSSSTPHTGSLSRPGRWSPQRAVHPNSAQPAKPRPAVLIGPSTAAGGADQCSSPPVRRPLCRRSRASADGLWTSRSHGPGCGSRRQGDDRGPRRASADADRLMTNGSSDNDSIIILTLAIARQPLAAVCSITGQTCPAARFEGSGDITMTVSYYSTKPYFTYHSTNRFRRSMDQVLADWGAANYYAYRT